MATIVEAHNDDKGILWPAHIAPYTVFLTGIGKEEEVIQEAERVYTFLREHGIDVLFDDRKESPGTKFADCDLLGIPFRVVISKKTLEQHKVEVKRRDGQEAELLDMTTLITRLGAVKG